MGTGNTACLVFNALWPSSPAGVHPEPVVFCHRGIKPLSLVTNPYAEFGAAIFLQASPPPRTTRFSSGWSLRGLAVYFGKPIHRSQLQNVHPARQPPPHRGRWSYEYLRRGINSNATLTVNEHAGPVYARSMATGVCRNGSWLAFPTDHGAECQRQPVDGTGGRHDPNGRGEHGLRLATCFEPTRRTGMALAQYQHRLTAHRGHRRLPYLPVIPGAHELVHGGGFSNCSALDGTM